MEMYDLGLHTCPFCSKPNKLAIQLNEEDYGQRPEPGDAMICIRCGEIGILGEDGRLRQPSLTERFEIEEDENIQAQRRAWAKMVKETGGVP
jgi:hypothetical protein